MSPDGLTALDVRKDEKAVPRYSELAFELAAPRESLENSFVAMGGKLAACSQVLSEVSNKHKALSGELEGESFAEMAARLAAIREKVEAVGSLHARQKQRMESLGERAAAIRSPLADLGRTVKTIGIVAINARIASAETEIGAESAVNFTLGMANLALDTGNVVKSFQKAHASLTGFLARAQAMNAQFYADHGESVERIPDRITGHLDSIKDSRNSATANMTERTRRLTGQTASRVASAVSSLQIGDITRQRIEHIEAVLGTLAGVSDAEGERSAICRLQGDQLDAAVSDFDREVDNLDASLRDLARDSGDALDANCREAWSLARTAGSALAAVAIELDDVRAVLHDYQSVRGALDEVGGSIVEAVSEMVGYLDSIREIEQDMRLLSLNTVVQCGRFGRGGVVLKAIAQELRKLTEETVTNAESIIRELNEAGAVSRELADDAASNRTADMDVFLGEIGSAKTVFDGVVERLEHAAEEIEDMKCRALELLSDAVAGTVVRDELAPPLRRIRDEIAAMAGSGTGDISGIDPDYVAEMRARYTMDSERILHDAIFGAPPGGDVDEDSGAEGAEADMDDIFF